MKICETLKSDEDRILGISQPSKKMHYLAIFLPNSIVTGMPYLPAKDEVVSFDLFSSRGF